MRHLLPLLALLLPLSTFADPQWVTYPGPGKHIVLISGDEEYRSEEGLPQLARILSQRHGFDCTVLFSVNPGTGEIDPKFVGNIPGIEALDSADLLIILTRFRALPDEQMKHVDDFLKAGKPVIGLRTATHAFSGLKAPWDHYNWNYKGADAAWAQGFGRVVLGETWINHHGSHMNDATRGVFAPGAAGSPFLNGIKDGEIWGSTDVYGVRTPLPGDSKPLLLGQVLKRKGPKKSPEEDPFFGMRPDDQPAAGDKRNDPMM